MAVRKRKVTRRNYRDFYKTTLMVDFGSDIAIHHINENKNDNSIQNLVALPRHLHSRFHSLKQFAKECQEGLLTLDRITPKELRVLNDYINCYKECMEWVKKRNEAACRVGISCDMEFSARDIYLHEHGREVAL